MDHTNVAVNGMFTVDVAICSLRISRIHTNTVWYVEIAGHCNILRRINQQSNRPYFTFIHRLRLSDTGTQ